MVFWVWLGAFVVFGIAGIVWRKKRSKPSLESFLIPNPPKDTVILHQFGPAPFVPSVSPFVIKLETYLRVANIPYINKLDRKFGPKGKLPWIQYNNQVIADSQACIEFLNEQFGVDLNKKLTQQQLALGHMVRRTAEEYLYWFLVAWRLKFDANSTLYRTMGLPAPVVWYLRKVTGDRLHSQGLGRHSEEECTKLLEDDLKALATLLETSSFLFSNNPDDVTEFDCALFGQLCQLIWQLPGTKIQQRIQEKFPVLVKFCEKMKAAYWKDWESRLTPSSAAKDRKMSDEKTPEVGSSASTRPNRNLVKGQSDVIGFRGDVALTSRVSARVVT